MPTVANATTQEKRYGMTLATLAAPPVIFIDGDTTVGGKSDKAEIEKVMLI